MWVKNIIHISHKNRTNAVGLESPGPAEVGGGALVEMGQGLQEGGREDVLPPGHFGPSAGGRGRTPHRRRTWCWRCWWMWWLWWCCSRRHFVVDRLRWWGGGSCGGGAVVMLLLRLLWWGGLEPIRLQQLDLVHHILHRQFHVHLAQTCGYQLVHLPHHPSRHGFTLLLIQLGHEVCADPFLLRELWKEIYIRKVIP